ncbi:hypothetical protein QBC47DRAFT_97109 [Echria macrotheca]|uniref:Uncharacterized protein n=1 Tax=Echria macrotheca TaxID=438768 RepID=A0AAJ0BN43_9PEZI|nr:hypothetical protein QBC47DRAFT_97109 [Echria macrotheca]
MADNPPQSSTSRHSFTRESEFSVDKPERNDGPIGEPSKPKSILSRLLSKLQSPAVKSAAMMDKKAREEEQRTGVKRDKKSVATDQEVYEVQVVGQSQWVI